MRFRIQILKLFVRVVVHGRKRVFLFLCIHLFFTIFYFKGYVCFVGKEKRMIDKILNSFLKDEQIPCDSY